MQRLVSPLRTGTKMYLTEQVVPALTQALTRLGIVRPLDPFIFLAQYMFDLSPSKDEYVFVRKDELQALLDCKKCAERDSIAASLAQQAQLQQAQVQAQQVEEQAQAQAQAQAQPPAGSAVQAIRALAVAPELDEEHVAEPTQPSYDVVDATAKSVDYEEEEVAEEEEVVEEEEKVVDENVAAGEPEEAAEEEPVAATEEGPRAAAAEEPVAAAEEPDASLAPAQDARDARDAQDTQDPQVFQEAHEEEQTPADPRARTVRLGALVGGRRLTMKAVISEETWQFSVDARDVKSMEQYKFQCEGVDFAKLRASCESGTGECSDGDLARLVTKSLCFLDDAESGAKILGLA